MTGVGQVPPSGPAPDGGGGSGKLILVIVLLVILLAAIGAGLWFLTDVFGDDGELAAVEVEEPEPTFDDRSSSPPHRASSRPA